jgi:hypothetical protein
VKKEEKNKCKACGCEEYELDLVGMDKDTETQVFEMKFNCGTTFEYVEQSGVVVKFLWEEACKSSTYH